MAIGRIRVGIGGWTYEPWRGVFYPEGLAQTKELAFASRQVTSIEINATSYRTQTPKTFRRWADQVPDDFVFALKASRYACNRKDLSEGGASIRQFLDSGVSELGTKLGPILWQLAPTKRFDLAEIEGFFALLPRQQDGFTLHHVIEPRHASFVDPDFVRLACRYGITICLSVHDAYPCVPDQTGAISYVRLQTTTAADPRGYDHDAVARWSGVARSLASGRPPKNLASVDETPDTARAKDVFVFVIGGEKATNPGAARALISELSRHRE